MYRKADEEGQDVTIVISVREFERTNITEDEMLSMLYGAGQDDEALELVESSSDK